LLHLWGRTERHYLVVDGEDRQHVEELLRAKHPIVLDQLADKTLYTDEPASP